MKEIARRPAVSFKLAKLPIEIDSEGLKVFENVFEAPEVVAPEYDRSFSRLLNPDNPTSLFIAQLYTKLDQKLAQFTPILSIKSTTRNAIARYVRTRELKNSRIFEERE